MKVFITNLPWSNDRRELMVKQLTGTGIDYEFFDCVIGRDLTDEEIAEACDIARIRGYDPKSKWFTKPMIGACLTSRNIHREILLRDLDFAVLLEDDTLLPDNFDQVLRESGRLLSQGDVALLYWISWSPVILREDSRIDAGNVALYTAENPEYITGGSATIFSREAARRILDYNSPIHVSPDSWGQFLQAGCIERLFCAHPLAVESAGMMSTLEHGRFLDFRKFVNKHRIFPLFQFFQWYKRRMVSNKRIATIR